MHFKEILVGLISIEENSYRIISLVLWSSKIIKHHCLVEIYNIMVNATVFTSRKAVFQHQYLQLELIISLLIMRHTYENVHQEYYFRLVY